MISYRWCAAVINQGANLVLLYHYRIKAVANPVGSTVVAEAARVTEIRRDEQIWRRFAQAKLRNLPIADLVGQAKHLQPASGTMNLGQDGRSKTRINLRLNGQYGPGVAGARDGNRQRVGNGAIDQVPGFVVPDRLRAKYAGDGNAGTNHFPCRAVIQNDFFPSLQIRGNSGERDWKILHLPILEVAAKEFPDTQIPCNARSKRKGKEGAQNIEKRSICRFSLKFSGGNAKSVIRPNLGADGAADNGTDRNIQFLERRRHRVPR